MHIFRNDLYYSYPTFPREIRLKEYQGELEDKGEAEGKGGSGVWEEEMGDRYCLQLFSALQTFS